MLTGFRSKQDGIPSQIASTSEKIGSVLRKRNVHLFPKRVLVSFHSLINFHKAWEVSEMMI